MSHTYNLSVVETEARESEAQGYSSILGATTTLSQKNKTKQRPPPPQPKQSKHGSVLCSDPGWLHVSLLLRLEVLPVQQDTQIIRSYQPLPQVGLSASYSPPATRPPCVDQLRRLLPGLDLAWVFLVPGMVFSQVFALLTPTTHSCVNVTLSTKLTSMLLLNLCLSLLSCCFRFSRNVLTLYVT